MPTTINRCAAVVRRPRSFSPSPLRRSRNVLPAASSSSSADRTGGQGSSSRARVSTKPTRSESYRRRPSESSSTSTKTRPPPSRIPLRRVIPAPAKPESNSRQHFGKKSPPETVDGRWSAAGLGGNSGEHQSTGLLSKRTVAPIPHALPLVLTAPAISSATSST